MGDIVRFPTNFVPPPPAPIPPVRRVTDRQLAGHYWVEILECGHVHVPPWDKERGGVREGSERPCRQCAAEAGS